MRGKSKLGPLLAISICAILLAACGPAEELSTSSVAPEEMEFTEEEVNEGETDEMEFTEEEVADSEVEEMEFEESEGIEVDVIVSPPSGTYTLNQSTGTIVCPNINENFPAVPEQEVEVSVSADELTVTMSTAEGSIAMGYMEDIVEGGVEGHWEGLISPGGVDQLWTIYWNLFGERKITGEIYNETSTSDGTCITTRPFEATPD
jgi:hypothetical protein